MITEAPKLRLVFMECVKQRIEVSVRVASAPKKVVKAYFENYDSVEESLTLGGVSDAGFQALSRDDEVQVDCVFLAAKLEFKAVVRARVPPRVVLAQPRFVEVIERRQIRRFFVGIAHASFVEFSLPGCGERQRWRIWEISLGGFGSRVRTGEGIEIPPFRETVEAVLFFPMHPPLTAQIQLRWQKKTVSSGLLAQYTKLKAALTSFAYSAMKNAEGTKVREEWLSCGFQFVEPSEELIAAVAEQISIQKSLKSKKI